MNVNLASIDKEGLGFATKMSSEENIAPTYSSFFGVMGVSSAMIFSGWWSMSNKPIRHFVAQAHWVGSKPIRN